MSLFVKSSDRISVTVFVMVTSKGDVVYRVNAGEKGKDDFVSQSQYIFKFRIPNFKLNSEILDKSVEIVNGSVKINSGALRFNGMITLLADWDLKDDNGDPVPVNLESISNLNPTLASLVADELDKMASNY